MVKKSALRHDLDAERDGVWAQYPFEPDLSMRIASSASPDFKALADKAHEPYIDLIRAGKFTPDLRAKVQNELLATRVKDWHGYEDDVGAQIPCTPEAVLELINDPEMHRVREWINGVAESYERYRAERKERALGN